MSAALVLLIVVVGAYLAAHVAFEWLARRFLVVSGAEYLLLGVLLGPQVSGVITADAVGGFAPFLTLGLAWVGALVGSQFFLPALMRVSARAYRVAFLEAALSLGVVWGVMTLVLMGTLGLPAAEAALPALAAGSIAVASAPVAAALLTRGGRRRLPSLRQIELTTAIDALVAIVTLGVVMSALHPGGVATAREPTATEWAVISVAIGCLGGVLFHLFLGTERKIDRLFVGLAGALILASGAAAYLSLSPLLPAMLVGAILVNTSQNRNEVAQVLGSVEHPLYFVLLIFAGAAWEPSGAGMWLVPVAAFVVVRAAAKLGGAAVASHLNRPTGLKPSWGLGLLGHGGLALALALNYAIAPHAPLADIVFSAALASILVTDLFSPRLARRAVEPARAAPSAPAESGPGGGSAPSAGAPEGDRQPVPGA